MTIWWNPNRVSHRVIVGVMPSTLDVLDADIRLPCCVFGPVGCPATVQVVVNHAIVAGTARAAASGHRITSFYPEILKLCWVSLLCRERKYIGRGIGLASKNVLGLVLPVSTPPIARSLVKER